MLGGVLACSGDVSWIMDAYSVFEASWSRVVDIAGVATVTRLMAPAAWNKGKEGSLAAAHELPRLHSWFGLTS